MIHPVIKPAQSRAPSSAVAFIKNSSQQAFTNIAVLTDSCFHGGGC